jgi:hypothetical protein
MKRIFKGLSLILFLFILNEIGFCQVLQSKPNDSTIQQPQESKQKGRNNKEQIRPEPELTSPSFLDYKKAVIYQTPDAIVSDFAYLRRNFTDQFISVWQNPGRIYPASRIFAFTLEGKYYRSCCYDAKNYVFGEQIVKGKMNLYYCRKLPQDAGLIEFVSSDPGNQAYRNNMIVIDENRPRFENDFYYFVSLSYDSLNPIPVKDFKVFADQYLKNSPDAYQMMLQYGKKKTLFQKILMPAIVGVVGVLVFTSSTVDQGILISSPLIVGGITYYLLKRKEEPARPNPDKMAEIIRLFNLD